MDKGVQNGQLRIVVQNLPGAPLLHSSTQHSKRRMVSARFNGATHPNKRRNIVEILLDIEGNQPSGAVRSA